MRNFLFLTFLGISFSSIFGSCKLTSDNKDVVVKIEPEFMLGLHEELGQVRNFNLLFQTIEDQACKSNTINFSASRSGKSIFLSIHEIVESENCRTGEGPATGAASYDFLPIGNYNLELVLKNTVTSTGSLNVSNEKYTLDIEEGFGFQAGRETLMRVPSATVWGYVAYKDSQHLADANNFLDELNAKTENLKLAKGEFGYFQVGDNDKLILDKAPDYNNFKTFYRFSTGQVSALESLLEDFRNQYPDGQMEFKIFTWQGETL